MPAISDLFLWFENLFVVVVGHPLVATTTEMECPRGEYSYFGEFFSLFLPWFFFQRYHHQESLESYQKWAECVLNNSREHVQFPLKENAQLKMCYKNGNLKLQQRCEKGYKRDCSLAFEFISLVWQPLDELQYHLGEVSLFDVRHGRVEQ